MQALKPVSVHWQARLAGMGSPVKSWVLAGKAPFWSGVDLRKKYISMVNLDQGLLQGQLIFSYNCVTMAEEIQFCIEVIQKVYSSS